MKAAKTPRPRHVPQRTCIGCREESGKRTFVRLVRTPEGHVTVDPSGRANGRGAYLHANAACWERALKGGTMNHALKITPTREDVEALRAFAATLTAEESDTL